MSRRKKLKIVVLTVVSLLIIIFLIGILTSLKLKIRVYEYRSEKINTPVRIALVTDLHSCKYGENESELINALEAQNPDIILLCGDIFDDKISHDNAKTFLSSISKIYPCYYVSGNHEYWSGEIRNLKKWLSDSGITVLEGSCEPVTVGNTVINICGADDITYIGVSKTMDQIRNAYSQADKSNLTILMAHRPELAEQYSEYAFDMVVSGHAHGGQWRIPYLVNGIYAPSQGLFPKYAGGEYKISDATTMFVSRGLAKETTKIPRIFNPPELVIINLSK